MFVTRVVNTPVGGAFGCVGASGRSHSIRAQGRSYARHALRTKRVLASGLEAPVVAQEHDDGGVEFRPIGAERDCRQNARRRNSRSGTGSAHGRDFGSPATRTKPAIFAREEMIECVMQVKKPAEAGSGFSAARALRGRRYVPATPA